jgi:hypothetical protein
MDFNCINSTSLCIWFEKFGSWFGWSKKTKGLVAAAVPGSHPEDAARAQPLETRAFFGLGRVCYPAGIMRCLAPRLSSTRVHGAHSC